MQLVLNIAVFTDKISFNVDSVYSVCLSTESIDNFLTSQANSTAYIGRNFPKLRVMTVSTERLAQHARPKFRIIKQWNFRIASELDNRVRDRE